MSKSGVSSVIEGLNDVKNTAKSFAGKLSIVIYSSVSYDTGEKKSPINDIS
jgi:hypothetical protein